MKCISVRLYFFGVFWEFLKIGKLTSRSLKGHGPRSPCRSNIAIIKVNGQKQVKMTIIQSQTEPFDQSATLFLLKNGGGGSGVSSLFSNNFQGYTHRVHGHYQIHLDGNTLTRFQFLSRLSKHYNFIIKTMGALGYAHSVLEQVKQWDQQKCEIYAAYIIFQ